MRQSKNMAKSPKRDIQRGVQQSTPKQVEIVQQDASFYRGPIPAPETLRRYEDLIPGSAATIIKMATDQAAHRQALERQAQESDARDRSKMVQTEDARIRGTLINERIGMVCGWLVAIGCLSAAAWSAVNDKPWPIVLAFLGLPVASMVRAFIVGKK